MADIAQKVIKGYPALFQTHLQADQFVKQYTGQY